MQSPLIFKQKNIQIDLDLFILGHVNELVFDSVLSTFFLDYDKQLYETTSLMKTKDLE